jgi:hypothetical protein
MRIALTFFSVLRMPISDIIFCAIEAEGAGFEYVSLAESFYRDASVLASAIANNTKKIKIGLLDILDSANSVQLSMEFSRILLMFLGTHHAWNLQWSSIGLCNTQSMICSNSH